MRVTFGQIYTFPKPVTKEVKKDIDACVAENNGYPWGFRYVLTGLHKTIGQHQDQAAGIALKMGFHVNGGVNSFIKKINELSTDLLETVDDLPESDSVDLTDIVWTDADGIRAKIKGHINALAQIADKYAPDLAKPMHKLLNHKILKETVEKDQAKKA